MKDESCPEVDGSGLPGALERLRAVAGDALIDAPDVRYRFACSGRVPKCVIFARDTDQVSEVLRVASELGLGVVPCGNGSSLGVGSPPRRYDVALSVRRHAGVVVHDAADLTAAVRAGTTLAELNDVLARRGQWLPLDPPQPETTTVGALIAADRSGPSRLACGKVRDYLIGVTAVTASGELLRGGGRVVKNVAGYDLCKLFAGSYGTLGVVVEANFKLRPRPACEAVFVRACASVSEATALGLELAGGPVRPVFAEAINDAAAEALGTGSGAALLIGCAGSGAEVDAQRRSLVASGAAMQEVDAGEAAALRRALCSFPQPLSDDALVGRVSVLPSRLAALLARFEGEARARGLVLEIAAHAGSGVAWCQLAGPRATAEFEWCGEWMRAHTRGEGGWVVFESVPAALAGRLDPWGFSAPSLRLMEGIKRALDPKRILSPGRFVGGL